MALAPTYDENIGAALLKNTAFTGPATVFVSLHAADPGATGVAQEITNGSGTSARQQATFTGASGVENPNATLAFTGYASGVIITHIGLWTAQTSGTFLGGFPIGSSPRQFTALT